MFVDKKLKLPFRTISICLGMSALIIGGLVKSADVADINLGITNLDIQSISDGKIEVVLPRADGLLYVGGDFTRIGDVACKYLALINPVTKGVVATFNAELNGPVKALALKKAQNGSVDKLYVGGSFTSVGGSARGCLAMIHGLTGALDPDFVPPLTVRRAPQSSVNVLLLRLDGRLYVGGRFVTDGALTGSRTNLILLNGANGVLDTTFDARIDDTVHALTLSRDGSANVDGTKLYVGGDFSSAGGLLQNYLTQVNADNGQGVSSFMPNVIGGSVRSLAVSSDGSSLFVGGEFAFAGEAARPGVVKLSSVTGQAVSAFDAKMKTGNLVRSLLVSMDGLSLYVGGEFNGSDGRHQYLARFSAIDGTPDKKFSPNVNGGAVSFMALAADEKKIYFCGEMNSVSGVLRHHVASIDTSTGLADVFNIEPIMSQGSATAHVVLRRSDGNVYIGGYFNTGGSVRSNLALVNGNSGSLVETFNASVKGGSVHSLMLSGDESKLYLGGDFTSVGGKPRRGIAVVDANTGRLWQDFDAHLNGGIRTMLIYDNELYIGGTFTRVDGMIRNRLAKVDPSTGSLIAGFDPNVDDGEVLAMVMGVMGASDARLYVGGSFTRVDGKSMRSLVVLSPSGLLKGMDYNVKGGSVRALAWKPGKVYLGGDFTSVAGSARTGLAAGNAFLNAPDMLDLSFDAGITGGGVNSLMIGSNNGKLYLGGDFARVGAKTRSFLAAVSSADGMLNSTFADLAAVSQVNAPVNALAPGVSNQVYAAGDLTGLSDGVSRNHVTLLNGDSGAIALAFNPAIEEWVTQPGHVNTLLRRSDGWLYVGGNFTSIAGVARRGLALVNGITGQVDLRFNARLDQGEVRSLLLSADGSGLYIGGGFSGVGDSFRDHLVMVDRDEGAVVTTFDPKIKGGDVCSLALSDDGRLYVGGAFSSVSGIDRQCLALLDGKSGKIDLAFNAQIIGQSVNAILVRNDMKIFIGGKFSGLRGEDCQGIALLDGYTGSINLAFKPKIVGEVSCLTLNGSRSKIYIGGSLSCVDGVQRGGLILVDANTGKVEATFNPRLSGSARAIVVRSDGKIYVAGHFEGVAGASRVALALLNAATGSPDLNFEAGLDAGVNALAVNIDGSKLYLGGEFTNAAQSDRVALALLKVSPSSISTVSSMQQLDTWPVLAGGTYVFSGNAGFTDLLSGFDANPTVSGSQTFSQGAIVRNFSNLTTNTSITLGSPAGNPSAVSLNANPYFLGLNQDYSPNTGLVSFTDSKVSVALQNVYMQTSYIGSSLSNQVEAGGINYLQNIGLFQFLNTGKGANSIHNLTVKDSSLSGYRIDGGFSRQGFFNAQRFPADPLTTNLATAYLPGSLDMRVSLDHVNLSWFSSAGIIAGASSADVTVKGGSLLVQNLTQTSPVPYFSIKDVRGSASFILQDSGTLIQVSKGKGIEFANSGTVAAEDRFTTSLIALSGGTLQTGYGMTSGGGTDFAGVVALGQKDASFIMTGGTLSSLVARSVWLEQNGLTGANSLGAHFVMTGGVIQAGFNANANPSDNYGVILHNNAGKVTFDMRGGDIKNAYAVDGADAVRISNSRDTTGSIVANFLGGSITANWDDAGIAGSPSKSNTAAVRFFQNAAPATIVIGDAGSGVGPTILGARYGLLLDNNTGPVDLTMHAGWVQTTESVRADKYNEALEATASTAPVTMKFYGGMVTAGVDVNPTTGWMNSVIAKDADGIKAGSGSNIILGTGNSADPDSRMQVIGSRYALSLENALSGVTSAAVLIQDGVTLKTVPLGGTAAANLIIGSGLNLVNDSITIAGGTLTGVTTGNRVIDCSLGNDTLTLQRVRSTNLNIVVMGTGDDRVVLDKAFVDGMANAFGYVAGGTYTVNTNATNGVTTFATFDWISSGIDTLRLQGNIALAESISDNSGTYRAFDNLELASGASMSSSQILESFSLSGISCDAEGLFTKTGHGLSTGMELRNFTFSSGFSGLTSGTSYWAIRVDNNTFRLAFSKADAAAGAAINVNSSGSNASAVVPLEVSVNNTVVLERATVGALVGNVGSGSILTGGVSQFINAGGGSDTITLMNVTGVNAAMFGATAIFRGFDVLNLGKGSAWSGDVSLADAGLSAINLTGGSIAGKLTLTTKDDLFVYAGTANTDVDGNGGNDTLVIGQGGVVAGENFLSMSVAMPSKPLEAEFLKFTKVIMESGSRLTGYFRNDAPGAKLTKYQGADHGIINLASSGSSLVLGTSRVHSKALDLVDVYGAEFVELSSSDDSRNLVNGAVASGDDTWVLDSYDAADGLQYIDAKTNKNVNVNAGDFGDVLDIPEGQNLNVSDFGLSRRYRNFESVTIAGTLQAGWDSNELLFSDGASHVFKIMASAQMDDAVRLTGGSGVDYLYAYDGQTLNGDKFNNIEYFMLDGPANDRWIASAKRVTLVDAGNASGLSDVDVLELGYNPGAYWDNGTLAIVNSNPVGNSATYQNFERVILGSGNETWVTKWDNGIDKSKGGYIDASDGLEDVLRIMTGGDVSAEIIFGARGSYRNFEILEISNDSVPVYYKADALYDPGTVNCIDSTTSITTADATFVANMAVFQEINEDVGNTRLTSKGDVYRGFDRIAVVGDVKISANQVLNGSGDVFSLMRGTPGTLADTLGTKTITAGGNSGGSTPKTAVFGNVSGLTPQELSETDGTLVGFEKVKLLAGSRMTGVSGEGDLLEVMAVEALGGGMISPGGADTGILKFGNLNIGGGGIYACNVSGTASDVLSVPFGTLNLEDKSVLKIQEFKITAPSFVIAVYANLKGRFSVVEGLPSDYSLVYNYQGGQIAVVKNDYVGFGEWAAGRGMQVSGIGSVDFNMDTDLDGRNDLTEFQMGTDPLVDDVGPVIMSSGKSFQLQLLAGPSGSVALPDYLAQAVITDPHGVTESFQSPPSGSLIKTGNPLQVALVATDSMGNYSTLYLQVEVVQSVASVSLSTSHYNVHQGASFITLTLLRKGHVEPISVDLATQDGIAGVLPDFQAARAGLDYQALSQSVTFAAGEVQKEIMVRLMPRTGVDEHNRRFMVALSNPGVGATLDRNVRADVRLLAYDYFDDKIRPVLTVGSPGSAPVLSELSPFKVSGTASDAKGVDHVSVSLNGAPPVEANLSLGRAKNTVEWSIEITPLEKGAQNMIEITAYDIAGNSSLTIKRQFTYTRRFKLTLNPRMVSTDSALASGNKVILTATPASSATSLASRPENAPRQFSSILPGSTVMLKATAIKGNVFNRWDGQPDDATIMGDTLVFKMPNQNIAIDVEFAETPFFNASMGNVFYGRLLAADGTSADHQSTGFVSAAIVPDTGAVSGKIVMGDGRTTEETSFAGMTFGDGSVLLKQGAKKVFVLSLPTSGRQLTLKYSADGFQATLYKNSIRVAQGMAMRTSYSPFNKVPVELMTRVNSASARITAGKYTVALRSYAEQSGPVILNSSKFPMGYGYGSAVLGDKGTVTFAGTLADGSTFTASSGLVNKLVFPFHCPLRTPGSSSTTRGGSFSGEAVLDTKNADTDMVGRQTWWFRPIVVQQPGTSVRALESQLYTSGWPEGIHVELLGAQYSQGVSVQNSLGLSSNGSARLTFTSNELIVETLPSSSLPGVLSLNAFSIKGSVVSKNSRADSRFSLSINPATGMFSGLFTPTWSGSRQPVFKGILMQKGGTRGGYGYFIGNAPQDMDPESGRVVLDGSAAAAAKP